MANADQSSSPQPLSELQEIAPTVDALRQDGEAPVPSERVPCGIGRYRIERVLGEGGFGRVYLGYDDELRRSVAIKVPHRHRIATSEDIDVYLAEARVVASLDHPAIVPVHDVGRTDDRLCYVVSKYIEGSDLQKRIRQSRPPWEASARWVLAIARALHHAHRRGVFHRDVKPSNILIDKAGGAYLTDFGLALREEDLGRGRRCAGTPAYMSPEQARGEAHLIDGRADIYSLGAVLYELLTGRRPFLGNDWSELQEQIATMEPRPPRQIDEAIPLELERICLKALSLERSARYATASDLASELHRWLQPRRGLSRAQLGVAAMVAVTLLGVAALLERGRATDDARSDHGASVVTVPASTPPVVSQEATLWVRRGGDDERIEQLKMQRGEPSGAAQFSPLGRGDDFKLAVLFSRPTHWLVVWLDTRGQAFVVARSDRPGTRAEYPGGSQLVGIDPADPPGVHLLVVLASELPPSSVEAGLQRGLASLGPPPGVSPGESFLQLRGPSRVRHTARRLFPDYLQRLNDCLPEGVIWVQDLLLPSER